MQWQGPVMTGQILALPGTGLKPGPELAFPCFSLLRYEPYAAHLGGPGWLRPVTAAAFHVKRR